MALMSMKGILADALRGSYCVGYFEAWDEYSLEAVGRAAERMRSPAFLGIGAAVTDRAWLEHGGIDALVRRARRLADEAPFPAAVLLNEAGTTEQVRQALEAGANAVMADTSHLPLLDNIETVRELVRIAEGFGACVEGEIGQLAGLSGTEARTDPREAARFVAETGVHALAVSVGSVHGLAEGWAGIDLDLLARIHDAVGVPLVLHGGSGLPPDVLPQAAVRGVAKINYGTRMKAVFIGALREAIATIDGAAIVHRYVGSRGRDDLLVRSARAVEDLVADLMAAYGSAGKASASNEGGST